MKTTIKIPDLLFRKVQAIAAERGQSTNEFVTQALQEKLASRRGAAPGEEPAWMQGFGKLRRLRKETARIQEVIDEAFEVVDYGAHSSSDPPTPDR